MEPVAGGNGGRRRARLWLWLLPVWFPVTCYLLVSLWLASPWGCGWVAARIRAASGFDATVARVSVTPWGGITLSGVRLMQPPPLRSLVREPVLTVDRIRVFPVWSSWLAGKRGIRSIEIDSPHCVVAREMFVVQVPAGAPPAPGGPAAPVPPPPVAVAPSAPATPQGVPGPPPPVLTESPAPQPVPSVVLPPTAWIRLRGASLALVSAASGKRLLEVADADADLPVAGRAAKSRVSLASVKVLGKPLVSSFSAPIEWKPPLLVMGPVETAVNGVNVTLAALTSPGGAWPVRAEIAVPQQKPGTVSLSDADFADPGTVAANARFAGLLRDPSTWQGDLVVEASGPSARIRGHQAAFDRGRAVVVLRGGLLSCLDARLIGDDLSLLGNATILANGRLAANARLVAPPEVATAVAAKVFPGLSGAPSLTSLSTPQRSAFDVGVSGDIRHVFIQAGAAGPVAEFHPFPTP